MKQSPKVSFIVVNYNGIENTRELLSTMQLFLKNLCYEVIVVDNGSFTNEVELLIIEFPWIITVRSKINLGFSGGNNLGIKASSGQYLLLLNNDTILIDNSICELVNMLENNLTIGAISPKIHFMNPTKTIQYAGFSDFTKITLRNKTIGSNELDNGQYDTPTKTASTHGAAMIIRREVVDKVGLMPEIYFLYYEEFDWCEKMKSFGYELWYQPSTLIIHKDGQSVGQNSYLKCYYITRNRLLFAWRNRVGIEKFLSITYQLSIAIPKGILQSLYLRRFDLIKASFLGSLDFFLIKNKYL